MKRQKESYSDLYVDLRVHVSNMFHIRSRQPCIWKAISEGTKIEIVMTTE